jgi:hypothetical protein
MSFFLNKIEAIHPRGRKWERDPPPRGKSGFRLPKGKTLVAKLDWLSSAIQDLITNYNFDEKTNSLLYEAQVHHSLTTHAHPYEQRLKQAVTLARLIPKVATEIKRLYAQNALPEDVDRKVVHAFLDEAKEVGKQAAVLEKRLADYAAWVKGLEKLGF